MGILRSSKLNPKVLREKIAKGIIKHDLPFKFVEYEGIRDIFWYLNSDVRFISRITVGCDVWKVYNEQKKNLKDHLSKLHGRICLTFNLWTSYTNKGYLCLTAHYVDLD